MKRTLLCVLSVLMVLTIKAGNVTPEAALQKATDFVKERSAKGLVPNRALSTPPKLKLAKQISGLYVFNAEGNNGFVIVSNDDRADAILGFADSGSFDVNNIPDNMRAWLEGYTEEIAWAKQNNITSSATDNRAAKAPIAPLIQTQWDQKDPYNLNCPEYSSGKKAATGCVATATAQAMYFNQWPASIQADIPASSGVGPLNAGTAIDWDNMQLTYSGSETNAQKTAVANLMVYLGCALNMKYGSTSLAYGRDIPHVLKDYFDYDETTEHIQRIFYSYTNWINIVYHELSNNRVVIIGGRNSDVGHSFICDGYQGEDFFHFNWGWGGSSDGYYKLSAVNPKDRGTGGGSTPAGYIWEQGAVIGIQKKGAGGTVSPLVSQKNDNNLTVNSISASATSVAKNASIDISFSITNNGTKDFDGDIALRIHPISDTGNIIGDAKYFNIKVGETINGVIPFAPAKIPEGQYTISLSKIVINDEGKSVYKQLEPKPETATITVTAATSTGGTDNVVLTIEPIVADATYTGTYNSAGNKKYDLLGNNLNASIRMTNATDTDYDGELLWKVVPSDFEGGFYYEIIPVSVPKNSHVDVPIVVNNLDISKPYHRLCLNYIMDGNQQTQQNYRYYLKPAITTYYADGTYNVAAASTTYDVPATALSVDLSGANVTTVTTTNSNPNCLYFLKTTDAVPAGLTNVIKFDGSSYTAESITLTDGNNFQTPVDFTATSIEFTYSNDRWADGEGGWNTIVLPFDVTKVTANGNDIDWFRSSTDTGKQFWLKEFTSDASGAVNFSFASDFKANTPYIIALPGDHWGSAFDLSSKTIKFIGQNAVISNNPKAVVTADYYRFVGGITSTSVTNGYIINAAGKKFEVTASGTSAPFRAYFKPDIYDATVGSLAIGTDEDNVITGISNIKVGTDDNTYYDLQGRRVLYPKKGLYILNGKKVIIK